MIVGWAIQINDLSNANLCTGTDCDGYPQFPRPQIGKIVTFGTTTFARGLEVSGKQAYNSLFPNGAPV